MTAQPVTAQPARHAAARLYRQLGRLGLIAGSAGNVSVRIDGGMVITPSGGSPDTVGAADLATVALDGIVTNQPTPSSEWAMHAAIYRASPDASAIVHTHADACTALACLNRALPAFHYMVVRFGGEDVRCAPYVTFGTTELAALAAEAIAGRSACLLANHGMIVHGRDTDQALERAVLLETLCRQYLLACAAGTPRLLTAQEMADARQRFTTYGPANPGLSPVG
ncbi:MAG TPA: class II aldolase/adducin family protein [Acetobacteraceae bacterium]